MVSLKPPSLQLPPGFYLPPHMGLCMGWGLIWAEYPPIQGRMPPVFSCVAKGQHFISNAFQLSPRPLLSLACLCPCHFSQPNAASHSLLQAQGLGQVSGQSSMPWRLKEGWAKEL